jgi:hypothetical protein
MSADSVPASLRSEHSDIRAEALETKRGRDHAAKYKYTPVPGNAPVRYGGVFGREPEINAKTGKAKCIVKANVSFQYVDDAPYPSLPPFISHSVSSSFIPLERLAWLQTINNTILSVSNVGGWLTARPSG